jgi:hypothetical protein
MLVLYLFITLHDYFNRITELKIFYLENMARMFARLFETIFIVLFLRPIQLIFWVWLKVEPSFAHPTSYTQTGRIIIRSAAEHNMWQSMNCHM